MNSGEGTGAGATIGRVGIEGEQLVLDYLSKVGDLAHTTSMSAAERAALVGRLRNEIGQQRSRVDGEESRSDIKKILRGMGRPEDVVANASGGGTVTAPVPAQAAAPAPAPSAPASPAEPARTQRAPLFSFRKPRPAAPAADPEPAPQAPEPAAAVPEEDLPDLTEQPKPPELYWPDGQIGGFVGGIEVPEMLRPPVEERKDLKPAAPAPLAPAVEAAPPAAEAAPAAEPAAPPPPTGWRRANAAIRGTNRHMGGPIELIGALLLVAGAALTEIAPLAIGWLLAYWSPRLSRREAQWATFGGPGLVFGGYLAWLFGRVNAYWGEPLVDTTAGDQLSETWPLLLRLSAVASAALLVWRARRPRP
jgi:hypothetical protein